MVLHFGFISILLTLFGFASCNYVGSKVNMSCENGVCARKEDQGPCLVDDDEPRLFRWEPIKVISLQYKVS